jgi:ankyrin repeat protein
MNTPLHDASRRGNIDEMKLLIDAGADVNAKDKYEWTPLHCASRYGHTDAIKLLMAAKYQCNEKDYKNTV